MSRHLILLALLGSAVAACSSDGDAGAAASAEAAPSVAAAPASAAKPDCPVELGVASDADVKYCLGFAAQNEATRGGEALVAAAASSAFVLFQRGSDAIDPQYTKNVRYLAGLLQDSELRGGCLMLAGHTDTTGTEDINTDLSKRRALALKAALSAEGFVAPEGFKLSAKGFGSQKLKDASDPTGAANRRVELAQCPEGTKAGG